MPQMSPMLWSLLFIYFIFLFMIFNILNYFNIHYYSPNISNQLNFTNMKNSLNWKW